MATRNPVNFTSWGWLIGYPIIYRVLGRSQVVGDFWTINRILQVRTWRISEQRFNVHEIVRQKFPPGLRCLGFCRWCFSLVAHYYHRHTMTQVLKKPHSYKYFHISTLTGERFVCREPTSYDSSCFQPLIPHSTHLSRSLQEAKSFLMPHGISMLRGPYQQQSGGVLGTLQSVKDTYEKDLKERSGSWAWNCLANFQLQVACDVFFLLGGSTNREKRSNQKLTKNWGQVWT